MQPELSIPVVWREDGGSPFPGRLDVHGDHLEFDGGVRDARRARVLRFGEIASARIGRADGDRINGRPAIVLGLADGRRLSFAGFDRPGALAEVLHRVEHRLSA